MFEKIKSKVLKKPILWGAVGAIVIIAIIVEISK